MKGDSECHSSQRKVSENEKVKELKEYVFMVSTTLDVVVCPFNKL